MDVNFLVLQPFCLSDDTVSHVIFLRQCDTPLSVLRSIADIKFSYRISDKWRIRQIRPHLR